VEAAERLRQGTPSMTESDARRLAQRITEPGPGGLRWTWDPAIRTRAGLAFGGIGGLDGARYIALLGNIRAPVTLVYGRESQFLREELRTKQEHAIPGCTMHILPGGHNLHFDAPGELARIIAYAALRKQNRQDAT
jgi:pimeloyl-ACP methyl ester carboxylesterase